MALFLLAFVVFVVFFGAQFACMESSKRMGLGFLPGGVWALLGLCYLACADFSPIHSLGSLILGVLFFIPAALGVLLGMLVWWLARGRGPE